MKTFEFPEEADAVLRHAKIPVKRGVIFISNQQWKEANQDARDAINYLCDEWDYCCEEPKTAQELHNEQIEGLSNGMSITEAKELAELKEQTLIDEQQVEHKRPVWPYILGMVVIIIGLLVIALITGCSTLKKPEKPETEVTSYNAKPCDGGEPQIIKQQVFDDTNVFNKGEQMPVNDQGYIDFEKGTICFIIINHIRK